MPINAKSIFHNLTTILAVNALCVLSAVAAENFLPDDNLRAPIGQHDRWQAAPDKPFIVYGDIRLRTEYDYHDIDEFRRLRERLRLRLGVDTQLSDDFHGSFGLVTGMMGLMQNAAESDRVGDLYPPTGNVTFEAFNRIPIMLNFAYVQYAPVDWFSITFGKLKNGLHMWAPSQLVWRYDVNPDGLSINFNAGLDGDLQFYSYAGFYMLGEYRSELSDAQTGAGYTGNGKIPTAWLTQVGLLYESDKLAYRLGASVQGYEIKGRALASSDAAWLDGGAIQTTNFLLLNPGWDIRVRNLISKYTLGFYGDYSYNMDNSVYNNRGQAFLAGAVFGDESLDATSNWFLRLEYIYLETHALPGGFGNPNAYGARPGKGMRYNFNYAVTRAFSASANLYDMTNFYGNNRENRWQLDFLYRF